MKNKIKVLSDKIQKLQEEKDGTLHGGFASLKGGFNDFLASTNDNCTNHPIGCGPITNAGGAGSNCSNNYIYLI
jgi:hypothetical protein